MGLIESKQGNIPPDDTVIPPASPDLPFPLPADRLFADRYEVRRRIGAGSTGAVFAAFDRQRHEEIALKVFLPEVLQDEWAVEQFELEVKRARGIEHPNVVRVFDTDRHGESHFITMELVEGVSLRQRLALLRAADGRFSVEEVRRLGRALCDALGHVHRTMVHGGVRPENVLLGADGVVKVGDLGTSRLIRGGPGVVSTRLRAVPYLAPEQVREGDPTAQMPVDHRADQYAVGAVLYEMLTGAPPVGRAPRAVETRPDVPPALSDSLDRALSPDAADRFADMIAFGAALAASETTRSSGAAKWVLMATVVLAGAAVATYPHWRGPVETGLRRIRHDPEAQAAAESVRLQALASAAYWTRIREASPDDFPTANLAAAEQAMAEGDRYLRAMDYESATRSFQNAYEVYETQATAATRLFRDEPTGVSHSVRALNQELDDQEQELYARLAEAGRQVDLCTQALRAARTDADRAAVEVRKRNTEIDLRLAQRLLTLAKTHVFGVAARERINADLDQADQLLESGNYRAALASYAEVRTRLRDLLTWPARAEEALRAEAMLAEQIKQFRDGLGPTAREVTAIASGLERVSALAALGARELDNGGVEDALSQFESARSALADVRGQVVMQLLARARRLFDQGHRSAAVLALKELLVNDPNHAEARVLLETIVSHRVTNSVGMELAFIPPGEFTMGSPSDEVGRDEDEHPVTVTVAQGFYLSTTEVTQSQWRAVMGGDPSYWKADVSIGATDASRLPVERVSWHDAVAFCTRLSEMDGQHYRLPTEAEWEYACRAGTTGPFSFGHTLSTSQANYDGNFAYADGPKGVFVGRPLPVESFPPNAWGLFDMHGNVWEWCEDRSEIPSQASVSNAGEAPTVEAHALRGGSWRHRPQFCRSANRVWAPADSFLNTIGFRVVLESD